MLAGASGKLSTGRLAAVDRAGDLGVIHVEHVMQQERGPLQRRQPLQRQQQRDRRVEIVIGGLSAAATTGSGNHLPT